MATHSIYRMERKREIDYNILYAAYQEGDIVRGVARSILRNRRFSQKAFDNIKGPNRRDKFIFVFKMVKDASENVTLSEKQMKIFLSDELLARIIVFRIKPQLEAKDFKKLLTMDWKLKNWVWNEGVYYGFQPTVKEAEDRLDNATDTFQVTNVVKKIPRITPKLELFLLQHLERHLTTHRILMLERNDYKPSIKKIKFILSQFEERPFLQKWQLTEIQAWNKKLEQMQRLQLKKKHKKIIRPHLVEAL